MRWKLDKEIREYIYKSISRGTKHYEDLAKELKLPEQTVRDLRMEEKGIRDGSLVVQSNGAEIRYIKMSELKDGSFNYVLEVTRRRVENGRESKARTIENKRREKVGLPFVGPEDTWTPIDKEVKKVKVIKKDSAKDTSEELKESESDIEAGTGFILIDSTESGSLMDERGDEVENTSEAVIGEVKEGLKVLEDNASLSEQSPGSMGILMNKSEVSKDEVGLNISKDVIATAKVGGGSTGVKEGKVFGVEEKREIARLYNEEYWTLAQLADEYRIAVVRVREILIAQGITIRPRAVLMNTARKQELLDDLNNNPDKPLSYFAKKYEISQKFIESYKTSEMFKRDKIGPKSRRAMRDMRAVLKASPQLSFKVAAEQLGISSSLLHRIKEQLILEGYNLSGVKPVTESYEDAVSNVVEGVSEAGLVKPLGSFKNVPKSLPEPTEVRQEQGKYQESKLTDMVPEVETVKVSEKSLLNDEAGQESYWKERALKAEAEVTELKERLSRILNLHSEFVKNMI